MTWTLSITASYGQPQAQLYLITFSANRNLPSTFLDNMAACFLTTLLPRTSFHEVVRGATEKTWGRLEMYSCHQSGPNTIDGEHEVCYILSLCVSHRRGGRHWQRKLWLYQCRCLYAHVLLLKFPRLSPVCECLHNLRILISLRWVILFYDRRSFWLVVANAISYQRLLTLWKVFSRRSRILISQEMKLRIRKSLP